MMTKQHFLMFVIILSFMVSYLIPISTQAQTPGVELPFAGTVSFSLPCTCSGTMWVWFTPLYLGGPAILSGPMVYSPFTTILYANLAIGVPTRNHLGSYIPAVQACWMYAGVVCFPLPASGLMTKVGTN